MAFGFRFLRRFSAFSLGFFIFRFWLIFVGWHFVAVVLVACVFDAIEWFLPFSMPGWCGFWFSFFPHVAFCGLPFVVLNFLLLVFAAFVFLS